MKESPLKINECREQEKRDFTWSVYVPLCDRFSKVWCKVGSRESKKFLQNPAHGSLRKEPIQYKDHWKSVISRRQMQLSVFYKEFQPSTHTNRSCGDAGKTDEHDSILRTYVRTSSVGRLVFYGFFIEFMRQRYRLNYRLFYEFPANFTAKIGANH